MTPTQRRLRGQIEVLIRVAAPALDLLLAGGDRLGRAVGPGDGDNELTPAVHSERAITGRVRRG